MRRLLVPGALAIGMVWFAFWTWWHGRTRRFAPIFLVMFLIAIAVGLAACGSSGGSVAAQFNPGTPAGTYTITVNAMSGSARITSPVMLKVM